MRCNGYKYDACCDCLYEDTCITTLQAGPVVEWVGEDYDVPIVQISDDRNEELDEFDKIVAKAFGAGVRVA